MENVKQIESTNYFISNDGIVYDLSGNIVRQFKANGYWTIKIKSDRRFKSFKVHRLVAIAFVPNPDNKPCVDHIDGVRYHNFVENLRWCTQKENMNYKPARRNKIKYNCQIVGYGADGKECVRFDNYIDAEKRGMYRHLIKKSVDTGKPYKGILYKEEK